MAFLRRVLMQTKPKQSNEQEGFPQVSLKWREILVACMSLATMLILAGVLVIAKTQQVSQHLIRDSLLLSVAQFNTNIVAANSVGLPPESVVSVARLQELTDVSPRMMGVEWLTPSADVFAHAGVAADPLPPTVFKNILLASQPFDVDKEGLNQWVAITVRNSFDQPLGVISIRYKAPELGLLQQQLLHQASKTGGAIWAVLSCLMIAWIGVRRTKRLRAYMFATMLVSATVGMMGMSFFMIETVQSAVSPLVKERVQALAKSEAYLWQQAHLQGFEPNQIPNVEVRLKAMVDANAELAAFEIFTATNKRLFSAGIPGVEAIEVALDDGGSLRATPDPEFSRRITRSLWSDYLTLALVLAFLWTELSRLFQRGRDAITASHTDAFSAKRDRFIHLLRPALFMYFLSEEFIRPSLPMHAQQLDSGLLSSLSANGASGLAISSFMVMVALAQPMLSHLNTLKKMLLAIVVGCCLTALGQLGALLSSALPEFVVCRAICGIGYALVFVGAQLALLNTCGPGRRPQAFATLVASIMAATVVGPALGGLASDNFGMDFVFSMSLIVPLVAGALLFYIWRAYGDVILRVEESNGAPRARSIKLLAGLGHSRFMALCLFAAVPAKMLLTGILFFLIPVYLSQSQASSADTGRVLLIYGVIMLLVTPKFASYSSNVNRRVWMLSIGLAVPALIALVPYIPLAWLAAAIAALSIGLGQSISITPQATLVHDIQHALPNGANEHGWLGTYRLIERIGNAAGPMFAAWMMGHYSLLSVFIIFGIGTLVCSAIMLLALAPLRRAAHVQ
jgi:MFS family permease